MPITVPFEENEIPILKEFLQHKKSLLYKQANDIDNLLGRIEYAVHNTVQPPKESGKQLSLNVLNGYDPKMKWLNKIKFLIKHNGGECSASDIVKSFIEFEPESKIEKTKIASRVSALLSIHSKEGGEFSRKTENRLLVFGINKNGGL